MLDLPHDRVRAPHRAAVAISPAARGTGLTDYRFNTGTARHLFCRRCGVKSFYVPRSNPDGYSVNVRCLDRATIESVTVQPFDDNDREASDAKVRDLSRESEER